MAAKGQLAAVTMQVLIAKGQLALVEATTISDVILVAPEIVESQTLVTLDATISAGTIEYQQTAGTTVTLTPSGIDRTFIAPATYDGDVLTFRARTTVGAVSSPWTEVSVEVIAHQVWIKAEGVLVPIAMKIRANGVLI